MPTDQLAQPNEMRCVLDRAANALSSLYNSIYHIWLEDRTCMCLRDGDGSGFAATAERVPCEPLRDAYVEKDVDFLDILATLSFANLNTMAERLSGTDSLTHEYRRASGGWMRGRVIVAQRDEAGVATHVLYVTEDVTEEHERLGREQRALYEASHDALTGALNRGAFERAVTAHEMADRRVAFLLMDIDNFKGLNDGYGHDFGDQAIVATATELMAAFRDGGQVFRLGGDEFAVLLADCGESSWKPLCRQLARVHQHLSEVIPSGVAVTLSVGATLGEDGLEPWMYEAADKGLYNTKRNGRAGCTLVDREGNVVERWLDEKVSELLDAALTGGNAAVGRLEMSIDWSEASRLVCGPAMREMFAIPEDATPEEAYRIWEAGVEPSYLEPLREATTVMLESTNVECSYVWNHPEKGPFLVRAIGSGKVEGKRGVLYGIHRSLLGTKVVEREGDTKARFSTLLLNEGFRGDYPMVAVLERGGKEYYLYDTRQGAICDRRSDYWGSYEASIARVVGEEEAHRVCQTIDREQVVAALAEGRRPEFGFDVRDGKEIVARYVLRFSTMDAEKGLTLAALRSVADQSTYALLRQEAKLDPVTGLPNRRGFFDRCRDLLEAHPDVPFSLARLDVRRFRLYNTFFGEEAGDELLRSIGEGLARFVEDVGLGACGRIEGDVFCLFVPTSGDVFQRGIDYLRRDFADYCDNFLLEPSLGIYDVDDPTMQIEAMLARATTAAHEIRSGSDDFVRRYDHEMDRHMDEEMEIIREMQPALEGGQFVVFLQPKLDFRTGRIGGAEALVRWLHPERGLVPPAEFISVFEGNGFIAKLDRYMWEQVCKILRWWIDQGMDVQPVSVNVSRLSACNPQTVPFLKSLVESYQIDPSLLELELTESAYIDDPEGIKRQLAELREYGFKVLMDDFGSGYSSLNTLRDLPVDMLKIDRMFLSEACEEERGRTVLSSMVEMAQRLGLPVVAEGVEDEEQAEYLCSLGCEYVQGYLFARPMPVSEYEELLRTRG